MTGQVHNRTGASVSQPVLEVVGDIAARYEIPALSGLLAGTRNALDQDEIAVAVVGRFKAGKSSFLNHFLGRPVLPAGVLPMTAAITEVRYGPRERATVHSLDGREWEVALNQICAYISERENPENAKHVETIAVEIPEIRRFAGLKFVDTPGLESALSHNTQTSMEWLPKAGLALVAVSVDPPLSQRDLDLLQNLYQFTPKVAILLTKIDLLSEDELAEVVRFVQSQLARSLPSAPWIFPYSTRPGFERFREELETALLTETLGNFAEERGSIVARKLETLLREAGDYLTVSFKAAQRVQSEREELKQRIVGEKEIREDIQTQIRLLVQAAAARTRPMVSEHLEAHQTEIEQALLEDFGREFPKWTGGLAKMLASFESWLADSLRYRLSAVSARERNVFLAPLRKVREQAFRTLQQFRDRLSERTTHAFGAPLRTTETDIHVLEPTAPAVRIGRVFDRNWELLSPVLPVWAIRTTVRRHFERRIAYVTWQNLSRLSSQWEESIHAALWDVEKEARRRWSELIATVDRLLETPDERLPEIQNDLGRLNRARIALAREQK